MLFVSFFPDQERDRRLPGLPPPRVRHLRTEAQPEAVYPPGELPGGDTGLGRRGKGQEENISNSNSYFINLFFKKIVKQKSV